MPMRFMSAFRHFLPMIVCAMLAGLLSGASYATDNKRFESSVRIGYVPHLSFKVDNGIASGSLANLMECSSAYFSHVEFVEMPDYSFMEGALDSNVIDIGLNMVKTKSRDKFAEYAFDLYTSRILLVGNGNSRNNQGAGILAVKQGSDIDILLLAKGYQVNTQAYSIDRLIEMYREGLINSFAESEVSIFDALQALDADEVDYDYEVLAEAAGGAYVAKHFLKNNPSVIKDWQQVTSVCAYLAPKIEL